MILLLPVFCTALFLNGATDAANAVTGAVASRSIPSSIAMLLAAAMEAAGLILSYLFFPTVADTVSSLADFGKVGMDGVIICTVCLGTVALWSALAWAAGLPTSESHGLMAAMCGCGAALGASIDIRAASAAVSGLVFSVLLGSALSFAAAPLMSPMRGAVSAEKSLCATFLCASAFLHGAQDGQKFLALLFSTGAYEKSFLPVLVCAALMGGGTLCGGGRIVKKMGRDMTATDLHSSCCADAGSSTALLILTALGLPVSTTHVKMSALAAASAAKGVSLNKKILLSLIFAWITTFPFCYFIAFLLMKLINCVVFC